MLDADSECSQSFEISPTSSSGEVIDAHDLKAGVHLLPLFSNGAPHKPADASDQDLHGRNGPLRAERELMGWRWAWFRSEGRGRKSGELRETRGETVTQFFSLHDSRFLAAICFCVFE